MGRRQFLGLQTADSLRDLDRISAARGRMQVLSAQAQQTQLLRGKLDHFRQG